MFGDAGLSQAAAGSSKRTGMPGSQRCSHICPMRLDTAPLNSNSLGRRLFHGS